MPGFNVFIIWNAKRLWFVLFQQISANQDLKMMEYSWLWTYYMLILHRNYKNVGFTFTNRKITGWSSISSLLPWYIWLCLSITSLLLPVSQQDLQLESTDQSPVSATQPLMPAWEWAIINTCRVLPLFLLVSTSLMFSGCQPQPHQASFVFRESLIRAERYELDTSVQDEIIWWVQEWDS